MRFSLTLLACLFPVTTFAATVDSFTFAMPPHSRWQVQGWTGVERTNDGLLVRTQKDGAWVTEFITPFHPHSLTIETSAAKPTSALILWDETGNAKNMVQLPVTLAAGRVTQHIDLTRFSQWNPATRRMGIALPAGADVTLHSFVLTRYALLEQTSNALKSLLATDTFQAFSINFLWGPLVAFSPEELAHLYEGQPPSSWSAMRFVFPVLLIVAAWAAARRRPAVLVASFCVVWLLLDLRMGGELLGYAVTDWKTYLSKPAAERVLRDREHYYATIEQSAPWLMEERTFGFLSAWPVLGSVRYFTYPSIPLTPEQPASMEAKRWLVFSAPKGGIDAQGRLLLNGIPVSKPGTVVRTFGSGAFLFETR